MNSNRVYSVAALGKLVAKGGSKLVKGLNSSKANALSMGLGIAGGTMGVVGGIKGLSNKQHFSVVYNTPNGPKHKSVKAVSPIDAIKEVRSSDPSMTDVKAFRLPDQDDQSQQYFESLSNRSKNADTKQMSNIYFDLETRQFAVPLIPIVAKVGARVVAKRGVTVAAKQLAKQGAKGIAKNGATSPSMLRTVGSKLGKALNIGTTASTVADIAKNKS